DAACGPVEAGAAFELAVARLDEARAAQPAWGDAALGFAADTQLEQRGQSNGVGFAHHRIALAVLLEYLDALPDREAGDAHPVLDLDPGRKRLLRRGQ